MLVEGVAHIAEYLFKKATLGLVGLVITSLSIEGDTLLAPLEDDFSELYERAVDDPNVFFVAVCSRTDHPVPDVSTTQEGYWFGSGSTTSAAP